MKKFLIVFCLLPFGKTHSQFVVDDVRIGDANASYSARKIKFYNGVNGVPHGGSQSLQKSG